MSRNYLYDKAEFHSGSIQEWGLPEEHAYNHTVPILRWFIERGFMSDSFKEECADQLAAYKAGNFSLYQLYEWLDCCLVSDMVNEEGNAFGMYYFDFEKGKYLSDYTATLQGDLPSEFHVVYSEENYARLKSVIDQRFEEWKKLEPEPESKPKSWWQKLF
jgi:hypothetical protein